MIMIITVVCASMLFGCNQENVVPTEEVDLIQSDYHETPEGGLSDREGCLGC